MAEAKETGLLVEGMKSYPRALAAMNEFWRLVVSNIRKVVIEDLDNLSSAIGVRLAEDEVGDYVRPSKLTAFDPEDAALGVRIDKIGKSGWGLYFYLWWSKDQPNLSVSIWLKDSDIAQSMVKAFKKFSPTTRLELGGGREVYISRVIEPNKADQLPVILRELDQEFSKLWKKSGGLHTFLKP